MSKYIIIGNSAAAVGAVEGIRQNDKNGDILIISNEGYHTYSRPLISYYLGGKTTEEKMKYRADNFYNDNKCELLLNTNVVKIEPKEKQVVLESGDSISYDKLLVATGSSPFVPPINGVDRVKNKFTFTTFEDAKELEKVITENSRVLIVGAGLIGLKCAEGICKKVKSVACVDLSSKVLSSILDDESAELVKKNLEDNHIQFYLSQQVKEFTENKAMLESGETIEFDVLVLAVGVRANISLIKDAGGKTNRGIVIDEKCHTSIPFVYSAGDCTEGIDASTGELKVMALLPNAYMQGECAGLNMSGVDTTFDTAIPMNAIGFFGIHIVTAGTYTGDIYYECDGNNFKKLFYSNNKLNGYILVGDKADGTSAYSKAGIYTSLVREKTPLDSLDFELICKQPGLMAFSKEARAEKLGGASR